MSSLKTLLPLFLIIFHYSEAKLKAITNNKENLAAFVAIHDVVDVFFVNPGILVEIFVFHRENEDNFDENSEENNSRPSTKDVNSPKYQEVASKFLSKSTNFTYRLSTNQTKYVNVQLYAARKSIIFFIHSCADFLHIHYEFIPFNRYIRPTMFLVYIENCSFNYLTANLEKLIQLQRLSMRKGAIENFEYLLINDVSLLYLTSIEWFSPTICNRAHLKVINTFNKSTQKWSKKLKNHKKFQNFHRCELVMLLYKRTGGEKLGSYEIDSQSKSIIPVGLTPTIFTLIAKKFNFRPDFQAGKLHKPMTIFHSSNGVTLDHVNGSYKHPDVCFEVIRFKQMNTMFAQTTVSFLEVRDIILVTPGELYSSFEKLFLPFDDWTWQLIVITFVTAFVAIFVINRLPKIFQTTIYGENVTTPVLNVVSSFFGISQVKLPDKNFPRFILTMFVMFCLIFRTCYQSKLFEFMTSEPRRAPPKSIEDLVDRNYTMYVALDFAAGEPLTANENWPNIKTVDIFEYSNIFKTQSQNSSARIAMTMQSMMLDHYESVTGDAKFWLQIPDTSVQVSQIGFSMFANNFFLQGLNQVTEQLVASGIMCKIVEEVMGSKRKFVKTSEPQTLSIENLGFGFIIWISFCGYCVLIFMLELTIGSFVKLFVDSETFENGCARNWIRMKMEIVLRLTKRIFKQLRKIWSRLMQLVGKN
ncbi:hypothetical protein ACKWTF_014762 [Chironomus riparius]